MASEVVEASGHLIDSGILNGIFDTVIRHNAAFEVVRFTIGKTNDEPSLLPMRVTRRHRRGRPDVVENLVPLGCLIVSKQDVTTRVADQDGCAPVDFYSTTNHETHIRRRRQVAAGRRSAHGRGHRPRRRPAPRAGNCATSGRATRRLRRRRDPRRADVPGSRPPRLRVHVQRGVVGAARRGGRRPRRRDDAGGPGRRRTDRDRRRPGRRPYRRRAVSGAVDSRGASCRSCCRATPSPFTTSSSRCSARRSASTSKPAAPSKAGTITTCARSTPCVAPAASAQAVEQGIVKSGIITSARKAASSTCSPAASATMVRCPRR